MKSQVYYLTKSNKICLLENGLLYFTGSDSKLYIGPSTLLGYHDYIYLGEL